jgi:hypothetical protein
MTILKNVAKIKSATGYDVLYSQTSADMVIADNPLPGIGTASGANQDEINAAIDAKYTELSGSVQTRLNNGRLEYLDGTEWRSMTTSAIVASNTARDTLIGATPYVATPGQGYLLFAKFVPAGTGEIIISLEARSANNATASGTIHVATTGGTGSGYVGSTMDYIPNWYDYRSNIGAASSTAPTIQQAHTFSGGTFVTLNLPYKIMFRAPMYLFISGASGVNYEIRNVALKYDLI